MATRNKVSILALALMALISLSMFQSFAQSPRAARTKGATPASVPAAGPVSAAQVTLALLPTSNIVMYLDLKRMLSEAMPRLLVENPTELARINAELDKFKTKTGFDARSFERLAVGLRFNTNTKGVTTTDAVAIAQGSFNATALIAAGRLAMPGKYQEQKYKGKSLYIFTINDQIKLPAPLNMMHIRELAVAALDANTLALGEPVAVRATLDGTTQAGRVNNDLVQMAIRTPDAMMSFGADVPPAVMQSLKIGNDEISRNVTSIRQAYGALSLTANGYEIVTIARTEQAEQAQGLSEMLSGLKQIGGMLVTQLPAEQARIAKNALDSLSITANNNEAQIKLEILQADLQTLIRMLTKKR